MFGVRGTLFGRRSPGEGWRRLVSDVNRGEKHFTERRRWNCTIRWRRKSTFVVAFVTTSDGPWVFLACTQYAGRRPRWSMTCISFQVWVKVLFSPLFSDQNLRVALKNISNKKKKLTGTVRMLRIAKNLCIVSKIAYLQKFVLVWIVTYAKLYFELSLLFTYDWCNYAIMILENWALIQENEVSSTSDSEEEQQLPTGKESQYCWCQRARCVCGGSCWKPPRYTRETDPHDCTRGLLNNSARWRDAQI